MATTPLARDFKELLKSLNSAGVEYLVVGGYAVAYHGYPRTTNDLDVWVAVNPGNADRIVRALREFGFDVPDLSPQMFLRPDRIIRMGLPPVRVELLTGASGVSFQECWTERIVDTLDDIEVNLINLRHLRANKKASGRLKDLSDLENLPEK